MMGFFDNETAEAPTPETTDISGMVPHDEEAKEFFAENNEGVEAPVEEAPPVDSGDTALPSTEVAAPEEKSDSSVPISELLLERHKRQEMEKQIGDQQHTLSLLNERILHAQQMQDADRTRQQQTAQQQQVADEMPDPEEQPLEHANWKVDRLERQMRNMAGHMAQQRRQDMAQQQETAATSAVQGVVQQSQNLQTQFANQTPDYWDALEFLTKNRTEELTSMGYQGDELNQIIENERGLIVTSSVNRDQSGQMAGWKQNPAEVAYNLAKMRGYITAEERQAYQAQQAQQTQQPQAQQAVEVPARDRMQMVNNGMAASSNANSGSTPNTGSVGIEQLVEMTDLEFSQFSEANPGVVEALLGN